MNEYENHSTFQKISKMSFKIEIKYINSNEDNRRWHPGGKPGLIVQK